MVTGLFDFFFFLVSDFDVLIAVEMIFIESWIILALSKELLRKSSHRGLSGLSHSMPMSGMLSIRLIPMFLFATPTFLLSVTRTGTERETGHKIIISSGSTDPRPDFRPWNQGCIRASDAVSLLAGSTSSIMDKIPFPAGEIRYNNFLQ